MNGVRRLSPSLLVLLTAATACGDGSTAGSSSVPATVDPGTAPWSVVARDQVREECGLDPDLLDAANEAIGQPWAVVRHGKLCHEHYPAGSDEPTSLFSATKTMAATVTGIVVQETAGFERTGRKTGPLSDADRMDHWLDAFSFNPDATVSHVLGMVAFNADLSYGAKTHVYDANGSREINRLSDVVNTAIAQDSERLGANLEEFWQRFMVAKLGMRDSTWTNGAPDKSFASTWRGTVRDMARLGLLLMNGGVWNGERLLSDEWVYKITHPAFEDANTGYGYLTWLAANSNYHFGGIAGGVKFLNPLDPCSPPSIHRSYPHGVSGASNCNYLAPYTCEQQFDAGVWMANGAGGQLILGHPGLDLVLVAKNMGNLAFISTLWGPVRPAVVAADPRYPGDEEAFCAAYGAGGYAPNLRDELR